MPMQCPIPKKMRDELSEDPYMKDCLLDFLPPCNGRIEWQHAMTYSGKRVSELYTILPLCSLHHKRQAAFRPQQEQAVRERIKHFGAEEQFRATYPRSNLLK